MPKFRISHPDDLRSCPEYDTVEVLEPADVNVYWRSPLLVVKISPTVMLYVAQSVPGLGEEMK